MTALAVLVATIGLIGVAFPYVDTYENLGLFFNAKQIPWIYLVE